MSVWFVLVFTVYVTCGSVNKTVCISLFGSSYNGSESMYSDGVWSVCAFVSMPQCFRHVGTCVQLLSPLIFCLVSVLSGISA